MPYDEKTRNYQKMGNALSEELKDIETSGKFEKLAEHKYNKLKIFLDFLLLIIAFAVVYFIKRGHFNFEDIYIKFLPLYFSCWVLSSILIDVTAFMVWLIENYPASAETMKKNPDYQYRFK